MATILKTRGGRLDSGDTDAFQGLLGRIKQGSPKILLHLHGGLVDEAAGVAMAKRLAESDGYGAPGDWEQVYIIWRTGAFETLRTNWTDLASNDRLYRTLLKRLLAFVSGQVRTGAGAGRSLARQGGLTDAEIEMRLASGSDRPFGDIDDLTMAAPGLSRQIRATGDAEDLALALAGDVELEAACLDIEAALAAERPTAARTNGGGDPEAGRVSLGRLSKSVRSELDVEADVAASRSIFGGVEILRKVVTHGVAIGMAVFQRYRTGRDHGLHATVVEEIARELYGDLIGAIVWGMMKGDASEHFQKEALGHALLSAVAENPNARLLLVAHSAGAIFACDMLLWAARESVRLNADVVFLAPAVRTKKFAQTVQRAGPLIARFRSFAMNDELERQDALLGTGLGFIYPSSLLYLVSGLFEEEAAEALADAPLLGMQRFLTRDSPWLQDPDEGPALQRVQQFLAEGPNRTVFAKVSGGDGLNCDAISHGRFDDETATLKSVIHFLGEARA
jgi:hypothetical protein